MTIPTIPTIPTGPTIPTAPISKPPLVATLLLRWMGPRDEAIVGDLLEGYRSGRSRLWFWRQAIAAILIGALTEVRSHKLFALRAVIVGYIVGWVYFQYLFAWVAQAAYNIVIFDEFLFVNGVSKWFYQNGVGLPGFLTHAVAPVTITLGWLLNGWTVGRFHRKYGASMVVAYVTVFTASWILQVSWYVLMKGVDPWILSAGTSALFYGTIPVMIGGLWGARRRVRVSSTAATSAVA
jgi:hypothetical protein